MVILRTINLLFIITAALLLSGSLVGQSSSRNGQSATPAVISSNGHEAGTDSPRENIVIPPTSNRVTAGEVVTIIESQSANSGHDMDQEWLTVALAMGFQATIHPQTALDDMALLDTTDVLIVSSGVIDIPTPRRAMILSYLKTGKPLYLQNEYLCDYSSNRLFAELVDSLGGNVTLNGTVSGDLDPMNVLGTLATTPNPVDSLSYFWYGCHGTGDSTTVVPFLEHMGNHYGFVFTPPDPGHGIIITTSDQDWVRNPDGYATAPMLQENILHYLNEGGSVGIIGSAGTPIDGFELQQNYPNPFNPGTTIEFTLPNADFVTLKVYNVVGQEIATLVSGKLPAGIHRYTWNAGNLASGVYLYRVEAGGYSLVRKAMLMK
ncbi:MAG: T9SS type A sorting domain-containing protein [Calditrichae bacterium]|nr:T9SS type A sorting domain-containing protein [Calditrichia bacterium]